MYNIDKLRDTNKSKNERGTKMNGTEKQIRFAGKLIKKMEKEFDVVMSLYPDEQRGKTLEAIKNMVKSADAGNVIDLLKCLELEDGVEYFNYFGRAVSVVKKDNPLSIEIANFLNN